MSDHNLKTTASFSLRHLFDRLEEETGEHLVISHGRGSHRAPDEAETTGGSERVESLFTLASRQIRNTIKRYRGKRRYKESLLDRIYSMKWSTARHIALWPSVLVGATVASILLGGS